MDTNKEVIRKLHQSFKRKTQRNRKRLETIRKSLGDINALIDYQDVVSSDRDQSENERSTGERYIILSKKDGSSTEDVEVENENPDNQAVDFLEVDQLAIAQDENSLPTDEAIDLNSSNENLLIFENDEERQHYVIQSLNEWALESVNLSMTTLDSLLNRLHPAFPACPKSYKTLLNTPSSIPVTDFESGGRFWYKGILQNLNALNVGEYISRYNGIRIDINMDGLPISKSSTLKFWPILGKLVGALNEQFIIGLYVV